MQRHERIFVALDTPEVARARDLAKQLEGLVGGLKVGKEFFTANGPDGVRQLGRDLPIFLDLKYHDIPNTVAGAVRAAAHMAPFMLNVHCSGGRAMMSAAAVAAKDSAEALGQKPPLVIGVTVLTSLDTTDLAEVGQPENAAEQVIRLARLAQESGLDGVVCSAREIAPIRKACGPQFRTVVPGLRPVWADKADQKRVMTPGEAVAIGADYLVIGRPITAAENPATAARRIAEELDG